MRAPELRSSSARHNNERSPRFNGYIVPGAMRRTSTPKSNRSAHLRSKPRKWRKEGSAGQELFKLTGGLGILPVILVAWASRPRFFPQFERLLRGKAKSECGASRSQADLLSRPARKKGLESNNLHRPNTCSRAPRGKKACSAGAGRTGFGHILRMAKRWAENGPLFFDHLQECQNINLVRLARAQIPDRKKTQKEASAHAPKIHKRHSGHQP